MRAIRFKVFLLSINTDLDDLNSLMLKAPFSPEYGSGIEVLRPVNGLFSAKYHEQSTLVSDLTDVYGNTLQNTVVQYLSFRFYIRKKASSLFEVIIESPPPSMRGFTGALRRILPVPFAFEGSKIDVYSWYKGLQRLCDVTSVRAIKAQTALANLDGDSAFKVAVESASDAIGKTEKLVGDQKIVLDKVKVSLYYDIAERTLELTHTYGVTMTGFADPYEAISFLVQIT